MISLFWFMCRRILHGSYRTLIRLRRAFSAKRTLSIAGPAYNCDIESESLERYRPGGYQPVNIDDTFYSERYSVLHRLGWGATLLSGWSTTPC
jgi:hypothetical protein